MPIIPLCRVYQSYLQNSPQRIPLLLCLHGLCSGSSSPVSLAAICRILSQITQAFVDQQLSEHNWYSTQGLWFAESFTQQLATKVVTYGYKTSVSPNQKLPITPSILLCLHATLTFTSSLDSSFWVICLVAFYGLFGKSHLLPVSEKTFDPSKQLTKSDFRFFPWGTLITIRWSKTIQFRERVVDIPLPYIPGNRLCPTTAILHATNTVATDSQAFIWVDYPSSPASHITCSFPNCGTISQSWALTLDHMQGTPSVEVVHPLHTCQGYLWNSSRSSGIGALTRY